MDMEVINKDFGINYSIKNEICEISKHAFLIIAHDDLFCLQILISMLDNTRNDIYLHIDKKNTKIDESQFSVKHSNLYFINNRKSVYWGHCSQIDVELYLYESAINSGNVYLYYHLISGVDLPIKKMSYIHYFFDQNYGYEFINFRKDLDWEVNERVSFYHFFMKMEKCPIRIVSIFFAKLRRSIVNICKYFSFYRGKNNFSPSWKGGDNWCSVTHRFVLYLLSKKKEVKKRFRYTKCGDEIYKQTIIYGSQFYSKLYRHFEESENNEYSSLRLIDWSRSERGNASPHVFTYEDKLFIENDSFNIFARKFSSNRCKDIINWVKSSWG